ncbi:MAG: O-antigen ligase family protein [Nitrospiraceae bacterium]|nr:O-antigen ligase family protein [Nitrospiraceae bacterium]
MNAISQTSGINPKILATVVALPLAVLVAIAITQVEWSYAALLLCAPFIVYLAMKRPFIFPFGLYVFSIPFENLLVMNGSAHGATLTRLLGVMAILALLLKGAFERRLKKPDKIDLWWILFTLYCLLSILWSISSSLPLVRVQTIIGLIGLYVVASSYRVQGKEYESVKWLILAGGALSSIFTIYAYHKGLVNFGEAERVSLMSLDSASGIGGANKQAFDMLLPLSVCMGMLLKKGRPLAKGSLFLVLFVMFFGIMITGSRGGLAAAIVVLLCFIFYSKNRLKFAAAASIILVTTFAMTPQFYLDRINRSAETHASGRTDIWRVGLKAMEKYWLFGAGLDCFPNAYTEFVNYSPVYMGFDRAPHNIFVGTFVELGIIGGLLMVIALIKHYATIGHYAAIGGKGGRPGADQIILKAAFWALLVGGLSQDVVWYKSFWLLWMMIVMQKYASQTGGDRLDRIGARKGQ